MSTSPIGSPAVAPGVPPAMMWARLLGFGWIVAVYLIVCAMVEVLVRNPIRRRRGQALAISVAGRATLKLLNFTVKVRGLDHGIDRTKPVYLISNHTGFMDVPVLSSLWPSCFVTSVEVQMSGILGVICRMGGCLFVERRNRERLKQEKQEIGQVIHQGLPVFVFPEATSSNGDGVLPFKAALFDCAIFAQAPIQPMVVCYTRINGMKPDRALQDSVYYYGDMAFFPQLKKLFSLRSVEVEVEFLPQIPTTGLQTDGTGRKELAARTHSLISETYARLRQQHHEGVSGAHPSSVDRPVPRE